MMLEVFGRVAFKFNVDEEVFKKNPEEAIKQSLNSGNAQINDGDNYLPEPWNEGVINDDVDFGLPIVPIIPNLGEYIDKKINKVSDKLREKEIEIQDKEMDSKDPEEIETLEKEASLLEGRLAELYEMKRELIK